MIGLILLSIKFDFENITTTLAFIVSVTAVYYTWKGLKLQREHNYKSVKPIGRIRIADFESKIYAKIENSGTGPLILKNLKVISGKKTFKSIIEAIPKELKERILWNNFTSNYDNRAIPINGSLDLIVWTINSSYDKKTIEEIATDRNEIRQSLEKLKVIINYTDIYEKNNFTEVQDFSWFGRNLKE